MNRSTVALRFVVAAFAAGVAPMSTFDLAAQEPGVSAESRAQENELYTVEELDNLLAPVALYPDPILAQLFVAATYPDQIALAARYVEMYGSSNVDDQNWDVSVRSIAHYAPVLNMLAERPNWATAVGRAYAIQSGDVMASVQSLRRMARAQGNLQSTDEQRVEVEREYIRIIPAQPRVVYVPVYDPYVVYYRPVNYVQVGTPYWSFGVGYPIGAWLNYDLDWDTRVVYYHGWNGYGRRRTWYDVSRPYIAYNSIYVGSRYTHISINIGVRNRYVNYGGFDYYNAVHRNTGWDRRGLPGRRDGYGNGNGVGYGSRDRVPLPDRYGIPSGGGSTSRPDKRTGGAVPRVGGNDHGGSAGTGSVSNGRPSRGDDGGNGSAAPGRGPGNGNNTPGRGNGNAGGNGGAGRGNGGGNSGDVSAERVKPVRVGGTSRPLYPRGEDISAERVRGGTAAPRRDEGNVSRTSNASTGNGTWNARIPERSPTRSSPEGFGSPSTRGRDADPVRTPRSTSAERISPSSANRSERSAPRYDAPRAERSAPVYDAPRSQPRTERSAPSSSSRMSSPRSSEPRMSSPRESAPRASAPRESAPRASAPRGGGSGSAPRASAPRGGSSGSTPRASRGGGRDRG